MLCVDSAPLLAQAGLPALRASPAASVTQTIGYTDVTVSFHRPGVKGREVFGGLVSFGQLWRVGANENTTLSLASPVTVNGQDLDAGTYGVHVIPFRDKAWTVIFSKQTNLWGSMGYAKEQDALRLEIEPEDSALTERMNFVFSPVDNELCELRLDWAEVSLLMTLQVDLDTSRFYATRTLIEESGAEDPALLQSAAEWAVSKGESLEDALAWISQAVDQKKTFTNLGIKAQVLEKLGRTEEAAPLKKEAWMVATEEDLSRVGGQLMSNRMYSEAVPIFKLSVRNNPKSWKAHDQLGEASLKSGDRNGAKAAYSRALELVDDEPTQKRLQKVIDELS